MITKIISGAQTGADQGALFAAEDLALVTGGWMPKGYRTDAGPRPDLAKRFDLLEHSSGLYPPRTIANVMGSDGTIIFGNPRSTGCSLTRLYAIKNNKPLYTKLWPSIHHLDEPDAALLQWIRDNDIRTLNVAGNRERTRPGIFTAVREYLVTTLSAVL